MQIGGKTQSRPTGYLPLYAWWTVGLNELSGHQICLSKDDKNIQKH